jgi:hypothetical protein
MSLRRELESLPTAPGAPPERRRRDDGWLDRWLDTCSDLARLQATNPMLDAVIDEIDGRRIRIGGHWLSDFASCNYLAARPRSCSTRPPSGVDGLPVGRAAWKRAGRRRGRGT